VLVLAAAQWFAAWPVAPAPVAETGTQSGASAIRKLHERLPEPGTA